MVEIGTKVDAASFMLRIATDQVDGIMSKVDPASSAIGLASGKFDNVGVMVARLPPPLKLQ